MDQHERMKRAALRLAAAEAANEQLLARSGPVVPPPPHVRPAVLTAGPALRLRISDGNVDSYGDRVHPQGVRMPPGGILPVLLEHDVGRGLVGVARAFLEDGVWLADVEFRDTPEGHHAQALAKIGAVFPSIGFTQVERGKPNNLGGLDYGSVGVWELSLVENPANGRVGRVGVSW
jgi:hypothetical protein